MGVFIGSIPNNTEEDVKLATDILKGNIRTKNARRNLERKFQDIFPKKDVFLFNRGREAMHFLYQNIPLQKDDEVILQAFTCIAVVVPILWSKAKPVFVDMKRETFNIDLEKLKEVITPKTKVIVVQHTFGNLVNMEEVRKIVDEENNKREDNKKILLLEDCAHLFDSTNKDLGKYSDAFFFSFAQDKVISCTQGALLVMNHTFKLKNNLVEKYGKVDGMPEKDALYNAKYITLWDRIKKYYFTVDIPFLKFSIGKLLLVIYRLFGLIKRQASSNSTEFEGIYKLSDVQAKLLDQQLERIEEFNEHRRNISKIYTEGLKESFKFKVIEELSTMLRYPILLQNPEQVKEELRKIKVIAGRWYTTPVFPISIENLHTVGYEKGSCTEAEFCCRNIINLPTNIEVTEDIARNIVWIINSVGKEI
ncbi:MAG: DegT/DnrJ/EryC1/StrS family aminotransferase [Candidatus Dojkabacteria bacterium]|jgi:perosamine synthetase